MRAVQAGRGRALAPGGRGVELRAAENTVRFAFATPGLGGEPQALHESRLVGFADGAALADIRTLLERADAVIVKGPTADGYFIVAAQGDAAQAQSALQSASQLVTQAERMP